GNKGGHRDKDSHRDRDDQRPVRGRSGVRFMHRLRERRQGRLQQHFVSSGSGDPEQPRLPAECAIRSVLRQLVDEPRRLLRRAAMRQKTSWVIASVALVVAAAPSRAAAATGTTQFLNHTTLLGNVDDPNWYLTNIPFLELPDTQIQQV